MSVLGIVAACAAGAFGGATEGETRLFYQYRAHTNNPSTFFGAC